MSGFKIKINFSKESVLLHVPGIGTATVYIIMVMRNNGITITLEILSQISYMRKKISHGCLDMIDFSPCELHDMGNVNVRDQGQPYLSQEGEMQMPGSYAPTQEINTETHVKLEHEGVAKHAQFESIPYTPLAIRQKIAHLQQFTTDTQRWIDQLGSTYTPIEPVQGVDIHPRPTVRNPYTVNSCSQKLPYGSRSGLKVCHGNNQSVGIQNDTSESMRVGGENINPYEPSTAMMKQHFEGQQHTNRFQQNPQLSQPPTQQNFRVDTPSTVNTVYNIPSQTAGQQNFNRIRSSATHHQPNRVSTTPQPQSWSTTEAAASDNTGSTGILQTTAGATAPTCCCTSTSASTATGIDTVSTRQASSAYSYTKPCSGNCSAMSLWCSYTLASVPSTRTTGDAT
ncbi:unnamed protein product [Mytilus coruscus]|uniref:Uncharacterized protein n=1 Tax=Mytilus coruscus TaxID=42192 RepID=A0A6J8AJJ2_MYTCO|nr:unnamed protein product [Mytilus coruscus]